MQVGLAACRSVIDRLLTSLEPSVRWRLRAEVRGDAASAALREEIRSSPRVVTLLSDRREDGSIPFHPYAKWRGAHWCLALLAELGYPSGDTSLIPLREQVLAWLLSDAYEKRWLPKRSGLCRMHASQDANAVWYLLKLGLDDERVDRLVDRLLDAQWPDGGWNCDPRSGAHTSSFEETLIPLRALAFFAQRRSSANVRHAAECATEVFLSRGLYRRRSDGLPLAERFLQLAYPRYWHYDILFGLTVLAEAGYLDDPRSHEALDLLEAKRLPDGGFPAEKRYYRSATARSNASLVEWGGTSGRRSNDWVSADALAVISSAKRLSVR